MARNEKKVGLVCIMHKEGTQQEETERRKYEEVRDSLKLLFGEENAFATHGAYDSWAQERLQLRDRLKELRGQGKLEPTMSAEEYSLAVVSELEKFTNPHTGLPWGVGARRATAKAEEGYGAGSGAGTGDGNEAAEEKGPVTPPRRTRGAKQPTPTGVADFPGDEKEDPPGDEARGWPAKTVSGADCKLW